MTKADPDAAPVNVGTRRPKARKKATRQPIAATSEPASPEALHGLSGVQKATLDKLVRLGITRAFDLVLHLPLRYDDETRIYPISEAPSAQDVMVEGRVVETDVKYRPRRQLVSHIEDGSGVLTLRFLNFYPSQVRQLATGTLVRAFGEVRQGFFGPEMVHPRCKVVAEEAPIPKALTPVYPTTAGLGQDTLRRLIERALAECDLTDTLPATATAALRLPRFPDAVRFLHNPPPEVAQDDLHAREHPAWRRIKFDELLAQQLSMRVHYSKRKAAGAPPLRPLRTFTQALLSSLPFTLTPAQRRVLAEIERDLAQPYPMQRLLQGDVGSGKTIVAA
ncbi:MAG TPA: OB-fold nucleic acid binding domain-containing protein, partial [Burkholderiales bacterium]|nr:OB-fold nucleic acid binding domain-containing protein [Burkholderiales bacterium]